MLNFCVLRSLEINKLVYDGHIPRAQMMGVAHLKMQLQYYSIQSRLSFILFVIASSVREITTSQMPS